MTKMGNGQDMPDKTRGNNGKPQTPGTSSQPVTGSSHSKEEAEDLKLKKAALYEATYITWFNTNIEADKTIITIASGGIGLLVTLLNIIEVKTDNDIIWYKLAIGMFITAIVAGIFIFKRNAVVLNRSLNKKYNKDLSLIIADYLMIACFILGILLTTYIGFKASSNKLTKAVAETHIKSENNDNQPNGYIKSLYVDTLTVKHLSYSSAKPNKRR